MILIFSIQTDNSTCNVIDWLIRYDVEFCRINMDQEKSIKNLSITFDNKTSSAILLYNDQQINLDEVRGVWYRKGGYFKFVEPISWSSFEASKVAKKSLNFDLWNETKSITVFLHKYLNHVSRINSFFTSNPNKLVMLKTAAHCGLAIPKTIITNSKSELIQFVEKNGPVITKGIDESLHFGDDDYFYSVYTEEVSNFDELPETFFPSKFQQKINKQFEIRVFYFFEELYAMAIFSQSNADTAVDFRKYDREKPNRCVPFQLPDTEKKKIIKLMELMNLNCGSLDLICDEQNRFVFLEINPVGQFGMVSGPCNYNLEKIVAQKLVEYERGN